MKLWRWFVGQVARLRRSVVGVFAPGSQPLRADDQLPFDGGAPGPPEHWVERVRKGAPGLLEPSFRRRGGPVEPPPTNRVAHPQPALEAEPESPEEPERGRARTEPTVAPQQPTAPVRARRFLRALRRTARPASVSPETDTNSSPPRVETAASPIRELPEPPPAEPDWRRFVAENGKASDAPWPLAGEPELQGPPVPDKPERDQGSSRPGKTVRFQTSPEPEKQDRSAEPERVSERSELVLFEAPVRRRAPQVEQASRPGLPAELAPGEIRDDLLSAQADPWPTPAPIRGAERLPKRLVSQQSLPPEASVAPVSPIRRRAEPLSEAGVHPWPELPPPLDGPDSDVEAALRAWEHQRRLDLEQTRL